MATLETVALEVPYRVAFNPDLQPSDIRVFLAISWFARGGLDRPSQGGIGEQSGLSRETVAASLRRLVAAGAVTVDTTAAPHAYQIAA